LNFDLNPIHATGFELFDFQIFRSCLKCNNLFLAAKYYLDSSVPAGPDINRKFQPKHPKSPIGAEYWSFCAVPTGLWDLIIRYFLLTFCPQGDKKCVAKYCLEIKYHQSLFGQPPRKRLHEKENQKVNGSPFSLTQKLG